MSKVLRKELEAKLASLEDPEWASESENDGDEGSTEASKVSNPPPAEKKKNKNKKKSKNKESAVVYLGHIPHGFYEKEMGSFFDQFGDVKHLRLSRSRRGGRSRGYAFIEFYSAEVAQIVAETMHGYFLEDKQLQCHIVPKEKVHERMFQASCRKLKVEDWQKFAREDHNKPKTQKQMDASVSRLLQKEGKKRRRLAALGIEYDFPGYAAERAPRARHVKFGEEEEEEG